LKGSKVEGLSGWRWRGLASSYGDQADLPEVNREGVTYFIVDAVENITIDLS
jgi:hypothetical protein